MITLADLIATIRGDRSDREMAEKGGGTSGKVWEKYRAGRNSDFPSPGTIREFARGLSVTDREVITAAAVGLGFDMEDESPQLARMFPKGIDLLSERSKRALLDLANTLVDAEVGGPDQQAKALAAEAKAVRARIDEATARHNQA